MSAPDLNFQAQVESVLSQLVKVATVELTKLFEARYQTFVGAVVRSERRNQALGTPERLEEPDGKAASCSVGVQVNALNHETAELSVPLNLSGRGDCLKSREGEEEEEEGVSPTDTTTEEENGHVDLGLLVKEDENQSTVKSEARTQTCCVTDAISLDHQTPRSSPSPTAKPLPVKPLPVKSEAESKVIAEGPLFPKQELRDPEVDPPEPAVVPAPVQSEPQQTNVSTAKGMAYSPSPLDGAAVASLPQVEAWECVSPAKEDTQNDLQMKLKRAGHPHRGLVRPCSVRLVNIEAAAKSTAAAAARHATGSSSSSSSPPPSPPPKDLRRHQGLHTGHRLCCYTACSNGVWRLQGAGVGGARSGYPCKVCGKNFKRRKILRRHERFHTGERPYLCAHCSKTFALRKSLRRHGRFHTGERPHDCTQCGKSFRLRENLKAHLRFHSGEKPYVCSVCGKSFRIARNLEKHTTDQCGFLVPSFRKIAGFV